MSTPATTSNQPQIPASGRGLFASPRRKVLALLIGLLAVSVVVLGVQSWRIVSAIVSVEKAAVVPLPPSQTENAAPPTNSEDAPRSIASTSGTDAPEHAGSNSAEPPTSDTPPHTSVGASGSDDEAEGDGADAAADEAIEADSPSRLEVVREVVEAGMASGDPGRSTIWGNRESLNILVLGVDRRAEGDQNADVIILAHLDLLGHRLTGVSLPRDLLVEVPGIGLDKINSSFNYGVIADPDDPAAGVAKVRDTVEALYGIPIDGYVMVDFDGFEQVIDAVDGVTVNVPYDIVDTEYPTEDYGVETITFSAGEQRMDGETALKYVRTRHADSDDARRERQLQVIKSIFASGKSFSSIRNADDVILAMAGAIQTSFPLEEQLTLARLAFVMEPSDIELVPLAQPLIEAGWTEDGRWVYTGDPEAIKSFVWETLGLTNARAGSSEAR